MQFAECRVQPAPANRSHPNHILERHLFLHGVHATYMQLYRLSLRAREFDEGSESP